MTSERRTTINMPVLGIAALGVLLAIGFFPLLFNHVAFYDDEGALLATFRRFLDEGSLYVHTRGAYGPFYYSFIGLLYRLTGQEPTLFNGRMIVLLFTTLSAGFFAATVWRVTRSRAWSAVCQVATFSVLIRVAGAEPIHPGSLIVLLISVLAFALVSYAVEPRRVFLVIVGATLGALLMTKINVGIFAAVAVAFSFAVGNRQFPRWLRAVVTAAAVLLPFALTFTRLYQVQTAGLAVLVSLSLVAVYAPFRFDTVPLSRPALVGAAAGAATIVVASLLWPLVSGTRPSALFTGVFIRPLGQADRLSSTFPVEFEWLPIVLTTLGAFAVLARRDKTAPTQFGSPLLRQVALAVAGLWVLGLGLFAGFGSWLPAIALLPMLAWISDAPPKVQLALRFLVPLAILQILHAYPVAGSQRWWGLVAMCVPCAIAAGAAIEPQAMWRRAGPAARVLAAGSLCAVILLGRGLWPVSVWHDYTENKPLGLSGARWVRVGPTARNNLRGLTEVLRKRCDTFYSAPGLASLYIFTGLPTPTGLLAGWPGVLTVAEQKELAQQLADLEAKGKRVCIVRDIPRTKGWLASSYGSGPLGRALAPYRVRIATVGRYSVSVKAGARAPAPAGGAG